MTDDGLAGRLRAALALEPGGVLAGFAVDPASPDRRLIVEILADGLPVALVRACEYRPDLVVGDGCYGFAVRPSPETLANARSVSARLANAERPFGRLAGPFSDLLPGDVKRTGVVRWTGGLTLTGWRGGPPDGPPPTVKALIDGQEVARASCVGWDEVREAGVPRLVRAFRLDLPRHLADGRVHDVEVLTEEGADLDGSPQPVFALADSFAEALDRLGEVETERVRARFTDGLLPQSVPFSAFAGWRARFPVREPGSGGAGHVAVLIVGEDGLEDTFASLERQRGCTWSVAALEASHSPAGFAPRALRAFREGGCAGCDLVVATVAGARLAPDALSLLLDAQRRFPDAAAVYGDLGPGPGGEAPLGFPAFDEELFLEQGYCALLFGFRPALLDAAPSDCDSLFALFPPPTFRGEEADRARPAHVPVVVADVPRLPAAVLGPALAAATVRRLARAGVDAAVSDRAGASVAACRVVRAVPNRALSVAIACRDDGLGLARSLEALRAAAGEAALDVVIADGGSSDPETVRAIADAERQGARVLASGAWSSTAGRLDAAARAARYDRLLFLRPGITAAREGWLAEMTSRLEAPGSGAIGALIGSRRGLVLHAGYVIGPRFAAVGRFRGCHVTEPGYAGRLEVAHEVSAVSAACMLTRRRWFEEAGGFDARRFPMALFDVDYCLRLRSAGLRVLFTPDARLVEDDRPGAPDGSPPSREAAALGSRWALVPGCDPFYSPWMAMDGQPFSGLAWPPAPTDPRQTGRPTPRDWRRDERHEDL